METCVFIFILVENFFSDFIDVCHDFCAIKIQENKLLRYDVSLMNLKKKARHGKQ
jgi:hypothetical protein